MPFTVSIVLYSPGEVSSRSSTSGDQSTTLWESPGTSVRQSLATGKGIGAQLLGGLAEGLLEKATRTYLKEDTEAAVREALAYLPSR